MNLWILAGILLVIAVVMTMTGRGGGNFYVLALVLSGLGMHEAATTGQFILVCSALAATIFFGKTKVVDWKFVFIMGSITLVFAFLGGLFSDQFDATLLKILFALFIFLASVFMLIPVKMKPKTSNRYRMEIASKNTTYSVNLLVFIPVVVVTGFVAGMVGISGGSFLVPLMVLAVGIPMQIAVGTSTALVLITASAGFLGHLSSGHFDAKMSFILAAAAVVGSLIGTRLTLKINPRVLKIIFAATSMIAALLMMYKVFY
ncbi:MAG: sulfite exporter TauE/SafE family protein [Bacteroidales bacterium]|nr:sulfite exporter TauE/SafE family protein [Bacteroidales bacterium]MDD3012044.1 sulfite exporter TauE/SafE family protein [Bacteroidales bacterium]MDD3961891.1 sulfite exporter TauE/SafE family protein [Bacteroidales bacterium]